MLIEAVKSGATIKMDDADWKRIRRAARKTAKAKHKPRLDKKR